MAYGSNQPNGLQAVRMQTGAPYNGQTNPYLIASGYANNIGRGDLVYINTTTGYLQNLSDYSSAGTTLNYQTTIALGVFNGCSFQTSVATNPIDPASPGRQYWPAGTVTLGGIPAIAQVIVDPSVVYSVQTTSTNGTGATQANVGDNAKAVYTFTNGISNVNTQNGMSTLALNIQTTAIGSPTFNFFIDALSPYPNNIAGQQYNNVEVMISNHYFRLMGTTVAPGA